MKIKHWLRAGGQVEVSHYWRSGAQKHRDSFPDRELEPEMMGEIRSLLDLMFGAWAQVEGSGIEKLADGVYKVDKGWL